jgi:hypothetical protein
MRDSLQDRLPLASCPLTAEIVLEVFVRETAMLQRAVVLS